MRLFSLENLKYLRYYWKYKKAVNKHAIQEHIGHFPVGLVFKTLGGVGGQKSSGIIINKSLKYNNVICFAITLINYIDVLKF